MKFAKTGVLQKRLFSNIEFLRKALLELGFVIGNSKSQILPIMIGPEETAVRVSAELLAEGVFAQAIRYPTVKKGSSRMRLSVTAAHTEAHLVKAIKVLKKIGRRNKLI